MLARTHAIGGGACVAALAVAYWPADLSGGMVLAVLIGSVLPDVDEPRSLPGTLLPGVSHALKRTWGHRGPTHSLAACVALTWLCGLLPRTGEPLPHVWLNLAPLQLAFGVGYASHLLLDLVSGREPLLWPVPGHVGARVFKTGGSGETLVARPVFILVICAAVVSPALPASFNPDQLVRETNVMHGVQQSIVRFLG